MKMMTKGSVETINNIIKTLKSCSKEGMTVYKLSQQVGKSTATTIRIVRRLAEKGIILLSEKPRGTRTITTCRVGNVSADFMRLIDLSSPLPPISDFELRTERFELITTQKFDHFNVLQGYIDHTIDLIKHGLFEGAETEKFWEINYFVLKTSLFSLKVEQSLDAFEELKSYVDLIYSQLWEKDEEQLVKDTETQ